MAIIPSLFRSTRGSLRPKNTASFAQPLEEDRRALFWWLKRNTSYTAIEQNALLWSAFAAEFEKWLRSQDSPPEEDVATYKYILDSQLCYEHGLKRLREGDRSVWRRRSSEGWLDRVNTGLVAQRMELHHQPDEYFEQFGIPLPMIRAYYKAHDAAMAVGHSSSYISMGLPQGSAQTLLRALDFDTALPEPRWDVSFAPGKRAPVDGIYEEVDVEGHIVSGMAYFIKGETASPDDILEFGPDATGSRTSAFFWRLLWEDTRYKNGEIPAEEALYPTPEQSITAPASTHESARLRCEGGKPCPQEGWWFTPAKANSRRHFSQGELLPDLKSDYGLTIWQWDEHQ